MAQQRSQLSGLLTVGLLGAVPILGALVETELFPFLKWYREANDFAQIAILIFLFLVALSGSVQFFLGRERVARLTDDLERAEQRRKIAEAKNETAYDEGRDAGVAEVTEEKEVLEGEVKRLEGVVDEEKAVYERIVEVGREVWRQPLGANHVPFVPPVSRNGTRILSFINLKGGVGKTTMTANLGACLAHMGKRVLIVDLDFQGTLGRMALRGADYQEALERGQTALVMLQDQQPTEAEVQTLIRRTTAHDSLHVIPARDLLEDQNLKAMATFLLDPTNEVRHRFRRLFHYYAALTSYDLVMFDCAPRFTAATVNAICASDEVVIPTQLTRPAVDAVSRTVLQLRSIGPACQANVLGVVANQVRPIQAHRNMLGQLGAALDEVSLGPRLFDARVATEDAQLATPEVGIIASAKGSGRQIFTPVAQELLRRML